jgi:signal transduction histidine kinase
MSVVRDGLNILQPRTYSTDTGAETFKASYAIAAATSMARRMAAELNTMVLDDLGVVAPGVFPATSD